MTDQNLSQMRRSELIAFAASKNIAVDGTQSAEDLRSVIAKALEPKPVDEVSASPLPDPVPNEPAAEPVPAADAALES